MSPVLTVPEIRVLSRTTGGAPLIGREGRRRTKGGDEERGGWKRPEEPQRPLPGDLWRAAGSRLWPPPLLLIGRHRGERRRAWCEGMVGRGRPEARVKRPPVLSLEAAASRQLAPPRKQEGG